MATDSYADMVDYLFESNWYELQKRVFGKSAKYLLVVTSNIFINSKMY